MVIDGPISPIVGVEGSNNNKVPKTVRFKDTPDVKMFEPPQEEEDEDELDKDVSIEEEQLEAEKHPEKYKVIKKWQWDSVPKPTMEGVKTLFKLARPLCNPL